MRVLRAARLSLLCLTVVLARGEALAQVDLTGSWHDERDNLFVIVQTGSSATVCSALFPMPCYSGSVSSDGSLFFGDAAPPGVQVRAKLFGTHLDGSAVASFGLYVNRVFLTRCQCSDGNANDGDGCDTHCQIEPCFSCSGDPSVCSPLGDGAACEDGSACTTGETCSGGHCGGGSPVVPCTDLTGRWLIHNTIPDFGSSQDVHTDISQTGSTVFFRDAATGALGLWGTIDPTAGTFELMQPVLDIECSFEQAFDTLAGSAAPGGASWSGTGSVGIDNAAHMFCLAFGVEATATRCGGGTLDPGEACDDGNIQNGDGCSSTCQIELAAVCGDGTLDPGETCDDGNIQNGDGCSSTCQIELAAVCGDGTLDPGEACDDGNIQNGDGCSSTCQIEVPAICPPTPRSGCRQAPHSALLVRKGSQPSMNKLRWTWTHGDATDASALGDPVSGTTEYALCVYGAQSTTPYLATQLVLPPGGTCGGQPCWSATSTRLHYRDPAAAANGIATLRVRSGAAGDAKIRLQAHGAALPIPSPALPDALIAAEPQVVAQLVNGDGACWEAAYSAAESRSRATRFSARR